MHRRTLVLPRSTYGCAPSPTRNAGIHTTTYQKPRRRRYSSSHSLLRRAITAAERLGASLPSKAASASWKSPAEIPRR